MNYNYGAYIEQCVASVLAQSDKDFSVTCIDNGSSDGSNLFLRDVCKENGWKFEEFPNLAISKIGNYISKTSHEPFITRLDADDTLCATFVAEVKSAIRSEDPDIIYGNYHLMDYDGRVFSTQQILPRGKADDCPIHDEPFHGACTVIRKEKLLDFGGYYEQFSRNDGYDLYLKFRNEKLHHVSEPLFHYRRGHRSMSQNKSSLFDARINMILAYAADQRISVGDEVCHIIACPNHPNFYSQNRLVGYEKFAKNWGRNLRLIARDGLTDESGTIPWSAVDRFGDLRSYLDESSDFEGVDTFVVHSMNDLLAPLSFFEAAPIAMKLFESNSVISGIKLESSLYSTVRGGVERQDDSRVLFNEERPVLHSGGLTGFQRNENRNGIATLLEISNEMTVEAHWK
ncbi:MAG: glycosyltransferase [Paracoccaceae bacterium]